MLVRTVLCLDGTVEVELVCEPVFDYGRTPAEWSLIDAHTADATGAGQTIRLKSDLALGVEGDWVRARHDLTKGEQIYCSLSWADELESPESVDEATGRLAATASFWRSWLGRARIPDHRFREAIQRSALAIKGLTYMPTGATVAAGTTSLPETPGGERNWDYRFTWMRDSTFTLQALHYLNLDWEAEEFMQFVADLEPNEDGALQIMYGIDGRRDLTESTRDDLSGYAGASPVRVGNGAFDQRQNDVFGAVLDSILLHTRRSDRLPRRLWPIVETQARCATEVWKKPDQGIWEARGKPQHYVSSKLMCWVALDRASKLAAIAGEPKLEAEWGSVAEEIQADILEHGVKDGVLRQHYDTDALDASTLLAAIFHFLPGDDERLRKSVEAIADDLTEDGFVLRYKTGETDDGLSGKEGSFLICSFWLVSALAVVGEEQRARDLMEKLLNVASPLGLYAEEFDAPTGRHLGNFPQAFSHLALIEAGSTNHPGGTARGDRSVSDAYDVIVIGSGAGRRHARPPPGSLRQADPAARARRLAPARAAELARPGGLRREPLRLAGHLVRRRRQGVPAPGALLRGRRDEALRRGALPAARGGLRRAAPPRRRLARLADLLRRAGALLHPGRAALPGPRCPRRGSDRATGERARIPSRRSPTSRGSSSSPTTSRRPATSPSTPPAGSCSTRATCRTAPASGASDCDGFPCLVHAKSDAEVLAVRPALEHLERHPAHEREGVKLEYQRVRQRRDRGRGRAGGRDGDATAGDIVVVSCGAANSAKLLPAVGERQASERARQRLRPGRSQLHVPRQHGGAGALEGRESDRLPEDARAERLLLRAGRSSSTRWATSRWSASPRRRCSAARSPSRRSWRPSGRSSEIARHAVDFWLSTEDLPHPDNRALRRPRRQAHAELYGDQRHGASSSSTTSSSRCSATSACTPTICSRSHAYMKNDIPVAGCAHQAGTCRFGTDPASSVLDVNCKAHELDNLYVVDTSFFPSIGAVNPALTAMANALRVGDHPAGPDRGLPPDGRAGLQARGMIQLEVFGESADDGGGRRVARARWTGVSRVRSVECRRGRARPGRRAWCAREPIDPLLDAARAAGRPGRGRSR